MDEASSPRLRRVARVQASSQNQPRGRLLGQKKELLKVMTKRIEPKNSRNGIIRQKDLGSSKYYPD